MTISDNNKNYISLREAARYCSYSQDYLKLRARQGKFRAVKIGRNWVTTKEWLAEYLRLSVIPVKRGSVLSPTKHKLKFRWVFVGLGLGLAVFFALTLLLGQPKIMLADLMDLIPGRVVEIK